MNQIPLSEQGQLALLKDAVEIVKAAASSSHPRTTDSLAELLEKSYAKLIELSEKRIGK
jgi:hypothetical protein